VYHHGYYRLYTVYSVQLRVLQCTITDARILPGILLSAGAGSLLGEPGPGSRYYIYIYIYIKQQLLGKPVTVKAGTTRFHQKGRWVLMAEDNGTRATRDREVHCQAEKTVSETRMGFKLVRGRIRAQI
jgi:hypothetical protein